MKFSQVRKYFCTHFIELEEQFLSKPNFCQAALYFSPFPQFPPTFASFLAKIEATKSDVHLIILSSSILDCFY